MDNPTEKKKFGQQGNPEKKEGNLEGESKVPQGGMQNQPGQGGTQGGYGSSGVGGGTSQRTGETGGSKIGGSTDVSGEPKREDLGSFEGGVGRKGSEKGKSNIENK